MEKFIYQVKAIIFYMLYAAKYKKWEYSPERFEYRVYFRARWYSPAFLLFAIVMLALSTLVGGILPCIKDLINEIKGDPTETAAMSGEFKSTANAFRRRKDLFFLVYGNNSF